MRVYTEDNRDLHLDTLIQSIKANEESLRQSTSTGKSRLETRHNLAFAYFELWELNHDDHALDRSIDLCTESLDEIKQENEERFMIQLGLAWSLTQRWHVRHSLTDLSRSIELYTAILESPHPSRPEPSTISSCLALALFDRWKLSSQATDLATSIDQYSIALDGLTADSPLRVSVLHRLALGLKERWKSNHEDSDLERAIQLYSTALDSSLSGSRERPLIQCGLAWVLFEKWKQHRDTTTLTQSIDLYTEGLREAPSNDPDGYMTQKFLALALYERWELDRVATDLDNCVDLCKAALSSIPPQDTEHSTVQLGLAMVLSQRWTLYQNPADLDTAIHLYDAALDDSANRPDHHYVQCGLSFALYERWALKGNQADLTRAIAFYTKALATSTQGLRPTIQRRCAIALKECWKLSHDPNDLDLSIKLYEDVIANTAQEDREHCFAQHGLGWVLAERWKHRGSPADLIRSISMYTEALREMPQSDPVLYIVQRSLAAVLEDRWRLNNNADDLNQAVNLLTEALETVPLDDAEYAPIQSDLARLLEKQPGFKNLSELRMMLDTFAASQKRDDLDRAVNFAGSKFPSNQSRSHLMMALSLVGRAVDYLMDIYDRSGRLQFLDQTTALVQSIRPKIFNDQQRSVVDDFLAKVKLRRVPLLNVSEKEAIAVGGGGFSDIYRGRVDNLLVAMKLPKGGHGSRERKQWFLQEIHLWLRIKHPYILELLGMCEENGEIFVISPWCKNENCLAYMRKHPEFDRILLLCQVAEALVYLHTFSPVIVHGDIKGENVLISDEGDALLCDFGLARFDMPERRPDVTMTVTVLAAAGTHRFMAPELLLIEDPDEDLQGTRSWSRTTKSDVFAFGRLILQVITGEPPFAKLLFDATIIAEILKGRHPPQPPGSDDRLWALCHDCWAYEPQKRPSMETVLRRLRELRSG